MVRADGASRNNKRPCGVACSFQVAQNIIEAKGANPGLPYEFNLKVKLANPNAPKEEGEGGEASAPAATPAKRAKPRAKTAKAAARHELQ